MHREATLRLLHWCNPVVQVLNWCALLVNCTSAMLPTTRARSGARPFALSASALHGAARHAYAACAGVLVHCMVQPVMHMQCVPVH